MTVLWDHQGRDILRSSLQTTFRGPHGNNVLFILFHRLRMEELRRRAAHGERGPDQYPSGVLPRAALRSVSTHAMVAWR